MTNPLQLVRFARVAEHLSFSEAARSLRLDQATLSRQIRQLEQEFGFALFLRTTRKVELTPQGAAILPAARSLAEALTDARREIARVASEKNARLRFGMHPFVYWSPQVYALLENCAARERGVTVETMSGMSGRHLSRLRARSLDVALVLKELVPHAFHTLPIMRVEPHAVLPEEHPAAVLPALSPHDLAGLRIAIFRPGREREDYDRVYGWFFANGAREMAISEGAAAVVFHATAERLPMISLRGVDAPPPTGFVRRRVNGGQPIEFVLARVPGEDRATLNHFWTCADRIAAHADK